MINKSRYKITQVDNKNNFNITKGGEFISYEFTYVYKLIPKKEIRLKKLKEIFGDE